jgi:hypothetical protein
MNTTTVAVDLAKSVFQLAVADTQWRVIEQHRLTRACYVSSVSYRCSIRSICCITSEAAAFCTWR